MLARVVDYLEAEIVVRPDFLHRRVPDLERLDALAEVARVALDVNVVADAQRRVGIKLHHGDRQVPEVVRHHPDTLAR